MSARSEHRKRRTASDAVVEALCQGSQGVRVRSFARAVAAAVLRDALVDGGQLTEGEIEMALTSGRTAHLRDKAPVLQMLNEVGKVPDAFRVDEDEKNIVCYEVEDTSRLRPKDIAKYVDLFWLLDEIGWTVTLITVDIYGNQRQIFVPYAEHINQVFHPFKEGA